MATHPRLEPVPQREFDAGKARHLLVRAGFGAAPGQVEAMLDLGIEAAVDHLVDYRELEPTGPGPVLDPDVIAPPSPEERRELRRARRAGDQARIAEFRRSRQRQRQADRGQLAELVRWWLARIIASPRPLEESLVLLWHGHFATRYRAVQDSYLLAKQNGMFRDHALDFVALARGIVRDPAMLRFLNNDRNVRSAPNENLARELMELFTLGEGHYGEADIKEGARALTGYGVHDNDFRFNRRAHDGGIKQILGRRATFDGDGFVSLLLERDDCPRLVATKLYAHFVADLDPTGGPDRLPASIIEHLARQIAGDGYRLAPALKTLLSSRHFYDAAVVGRKIKSPVRLVAGLLRTLGLPVRDLGTLNDGLRRCGQQLFNPPSVAGWDGGRAWISTSTLYTRQNLCIYLLTGKLPVEDGWTAGDIGWDPAPLVAGVDRADPAAVVDRVAPILLGIHATAERKKQLTDFLAGRGGSVTDERLIGLLVLITGLPEYQLC